MQSEVTERSILKAPSRSCCPSRLILDTKRRYLFPYPIMPV